MSISRATSAASAPDLWAVVSDVTSWPSLLPTFTSVTHVDGSPPFGLGARYHVAQPGLPRAVYEVTEHTPQVSFTWVSHSPGVVTTATHVVSATADGSAIDLTLTWHGVAAPLLRLLLSRKVQGMIDLEASTFATAAASHE